MVVALLLARWIRKCNRAGDTKGTYTARIRFRSVWEERSAAWIPARGPQWGKMSSTVGAKGENFAESPTMRTLGVMERATFKARARRVWPSRVTKALSAPMRVLL